MARRCFFTSYATFFLPQFSTLMTLPPSRWTIPRRRSTILSTRSSARSGRTRKMVSYSRSLVAAPGPPVPWVSCCCICGHLSGLPPWRRGDCLFSVFRFCLASAGLLRTAVELVHGGTGTLEERRHRRVGGLGDQLRELRLLVGRELREHPIRTLPGRWRLADAKTDAKIRVAEVLVQAAQAVVSSSAAADLHLQAPESEIDVVVGDDDLRRVHLPEPRRLRHRFAARIHVRLRKQDSDRLAPHAARSHHGVVALLIERDAQLPRRLDGDAEADVVPGTFVLRARVPEADEKPHDGLLLALLGSLRRTRGRSRGCSAGCRSCSPRSRAGSRRGRNRRLARAGHRGRRSRGDLFLLGHGDDRDGRVLDDVGLELHSL